MNRILSISVSVCVVALSSLAPGIVGASRSDNALTRTGHQTSRTARVTLPDGRIRFVTLQGVGCSEAICSRVAVRVRADGRSPETRTWLDAVAAIRDITSNDALFVMKDGTARRLAVVDDNRFIYVTNQDGDDQKINLAGMKSLEFIEAPR